MNTLRKTFLDFSKKIHQKITQKCNWNHKKDTPIFEHLKSKNMRTIKLRFKKFLHRLLEYYSVKET